MILSRDHTWIRIAALPDNVIERFINAYPGIQEYTPKTTYVDMVREIEATFEAAMPGKGDLVTQWFLMSLSRWGGSLEEGIVHFRDMATWYFTHAKEDAFRKLVKEHAVVVERNINPKNLLDFTAMDMDYIKHDYEIMEEAGRVNTISEMPDGSELIYDDGQYQIVKVTETDAACKMGMGTQWCTREEPQATTYLAKSPLYVIYRDRQKAAQFFLGGPESSPNKIELKNLKNTPMRPNAGIRRALVGSGLMDQLLERVGLKESGEEVFLKFTGGEDSPYLKKACAQKPWLAYFYAKNILHQRFPEGEGAIAWDGEVSLVYASEVVHGRFPLGESEIAHRRLEDLYAQVLEENGDMAGLAEFRQKYPEIPSHIREE